MARCLCANSCCATRAKRISRCSSTCPSRRARKQPDDLPMRIVIPAYILSELKTGFQIGAILFLPFLVIDMVTASVTTSIGMMQLPPGGDFHAAQDFAVRGGRRLEPGGRLHAEKFSLRRKETMSPEQVVAMARQTLEAAFWVAAPILISRHRGEPGDQHRAGDDLRAGPHGDHRAALGGGGRDRVSADALDAAPPGGVHHQHFFRFPGIHTLGIRGTSAMSPLLERILAHACPSGCVSAELMTFAPFFGSDALTSPRESRLGSGADGNALRSLSRAGFAAYCFKRACALVLTEAVVADDGALRSDRVGRRAAGRAAVRRAVGIFAGGHHRSADQYRDAGADHFLPDDRAADFFAAGRAPLDFAGGGEKLRLFSGGLGNASASLPRANFCAPPGACG